MTGFEQQVTRIFLSLITAWGKSAKQKSSIRQNAEASLKIAGSVANTEVLENLSPSDLTGISSYLSSPDIDHAAHEAYVARTLEHRGVDIEELLAAVRESIRLGLQHRTRLRGGQLFEVAEIVYRNILQATQMAWEQLDGGTAPPTATDFAIAGRLTSAAVRNTELLSSINKISELHRFERGLVDQIAALHAEIRLPHAGLSKTVPYDKLYVQPLIWSQPGGTDADFDDHFGQSNSPSDLAISIPLALQRREALVILGDPGAGKSTLASKLAFDLASKYDAEGSFIPLMLILRDFARDFDLGGRTVVEHLESICSDPYNVPPPKHAIEYMLLNGRAVVIFDGLDELTETSTRTRVARLIDSFASKYPMVPTIVTSRRVGYDAAPLSDRIFNVAYIREFSRSQIRRYATNWFNLDDSLSTRDRKSLENSFMFDSVMVDDLRRNPLMLSLLCGMYATERYIPRNRPDVFEKCAVMLFERWDRMRGVGSQAPFGSQVRSAVQHLAWKFLTDRKHGGAMPRRQLVEELGSNFYGKRYQDLDAARDEAESFLDFCTGRAWVLTDVGATDTEPRYGFTHRTFLEFFAAEHLVRTKGSSPSKVFRALARHLEREEWEMPSQLSIQILERNVAGGADKFFELLSVRAKQSTPKAASRLLNFAERALQYAPISLRGAEILFDVAFDHEMQFSDTYRYPNTFDSWFETSDWFPGFADLIEHVTPENAQVMARALGSIITARLKSNSPASLAAATFLYHVGALSLSEELRRAFAASNLAEFAQLARHSEKHPALSFYRILSADSDNDRVHLLGQALQQHGPAVLYCSPKASSSSCYTSVAGNILTGSSGTFITDAIIDLIRSDLPNWGDSWVNVLSYNKRGLIESMHENVIKNIAEAEPSRKVFLWVLLLPLIELQMMGIGSEGGWDGTDMAPLRHARETGEVGAVKRLFPLVSETDPSATVLRSWIEGSVRTLGTVDA
ncbi:NACHT domain-containing protein [Micromonospora rifamycinica]|uniref:NACHT domain-containing protein n=1 Tax=Micromonospora rifamycinica TaxID=291594 RepID=UPI0034385C95